MSRIKKAHYSGRMKIPGKGKDKKVSTKTPRVCFPEAGNLLSSSIPLYLFTGARSFS